MGCNECGLVYSLVFGIQYHKVDCTVGLGDDRSLRERRRDAEQARDKILARAALRHSAAPGPNWYEQTQY
tara:strand:- start:57 stop:266 length:210 start_codon:yes stop_codon:yes gene_type:complete